MKQSHAKRYKSPRNVRFGVLFRLARDNALLKETESNDDRKRGLTQSQLAKRIIDRGAGWGTAAAIATSISALENGWIKGESQANWQSVAEALGEFDTLMAALKAAAKTDRGPRRTRLRLARPIRKLNPGQHLIRICEVVDGAQSSLSVLTDACDYGSSFDYHASKAIAERIALKATETKGVRVLVCGARSPVTLAAIKPADPERDNRYAAELGKDEAFCQWFTKLSLSTEQQRHFLAWLDGNYATLTYDRRCPESLDYADVAPLAGILEGIKHALDDSHTLSEKEPAIMSLCCEWYYETELLKGIKIERNLDYEEPSLLYWLADGAKGVAVVVQPEEERGRLLEFTPSRDSAIIDFLNAIVDIRINEIQAKT